MISTLQAIGAFGFILHTGHQVLPFLVQPHSVGSGRVGDAFRRCAVNGQLDRGSSLAFCRRELVGGMLSSVCVPLAESRFLSGAVAKASTVASVSLACIKILK